MTNIENDFRIGIIREDGTADFIFSADDCSIKNYFSLENNSDITKVVDFYESIKDSTYQKDDYNDKHLFYMKQYLSENFIEEFNSIGINPQSINDDLNLYYYLSTFNNIVMVNSSEHVNLLITPYNGITKMQSNRLDSINSLFKDSSTLWCLANSMHIETFQENGQTFGMLEVGDTFTDSFNKIVEKIQVNSSKAK